MKISKKERREAVEQLEQFADTWISGPWLNNYVHGDTSCLCSLAFSAQEAVCDAAVELFTCHEIGRSIALAHVYLEAAALLRSGWKPGEPLEAL